MTGPDARLFCWSKNTAAQLCGMGHVLMENRNGSAVVDVDITEANGTAEREAATRVLKRGACRVKSLGAD